MEEMTIEAVMQQLRARWNGARGAAAALRELRGQVDANERQLEGPNAARDYIDYFADLFERFAAEIERIASELGEGVQRAHVDALRQIANNSAADQRRAGMFRDKWINKPLPYETMRPLLSSISNTTRDEINALRTLTEVAAALEPELARPQQEPPGALDRRQLFTRLFRPAKE
jgi:hypothetical protein